MEVKACAVAVLCASVLFTACHGQQLGQVSRLLPEDVQIYFPSKVADLAFGLESKRVFLVHRGRDLDPTQLMATGRVFISREEKIKIIAKRLALKPAAAGDGSSVLRFTLTADVSRPDVVEAVVATISNPADRLLDRHVAVAPPLLAHDGGDVKAEFNISLKCKASGLVEVKLTMEAVELGLVQPTRTQSVSTTVRRRCLLPVDQPVPATRPFFVMPTEPVDIRETPNSADAAASTKLVQLSAFLAAVGLIVFVVASVVIYLCYIRRSNLELSSSRADFDDDETVRTSRKGKKKKKRPSRKSKGGEAGSPQDALSYGDIQSQVHTQKSTLSAAPSSAPPNGDGENEDDEQDMDSVQDHGEAAEAAQAIPMNDTQRPPSLNSNESMSSVAPLITMHATYPWQYHSVFHGCIIDKDRIQIGQIVKQGSYGQVFEGTLGFPERLPIIVKTSTQSAHADEIQRLAFEAMVLKGAVHKYVHSVVGICFASTATNGVPVPPFLIFPMVPGQKSLKELLLHTRRVAGIRDSAADGVGGSVGRAAGKMLSTPQLVMMAAQIARGLRHLEKRNIVHKDVASRNCIVLPNLEVRIGDAALSCDLYPNEYHYHFNFGHAKVPLKWMPLECVEDGLFTSQSDVWSFGVTMWEIMTLGSLPFEEIDELELGQHLRSGKRLQQPRRCPFELFAIMARCWALSPEDRPGFGFLVHGLYTYAESLKCYI